MDDEVVSGMENRVVKEVMADPSFKPKSVNEY